MFSRHGRRITNAAATPQPCCESNLYILIYTYIYIIYIHIYHPVPEFMGTACIFNIQCNLSLSLSTEWYQVLCAWQHTGHVITINTCFCCDVAVRQCLTRASTSTTGSLTFLEEAQVLAENPPAEPNQYLALKCEHSWCMYSFASRRARWEETPDRTYLSSFRVPVRTRFVFLPP